MSKLIRRWIALTIAFWVTAYLLSANVVIQGDWLTYFGIAFIFGLANATVGSLLRLFTFPITFLTLGLWLVVINASMLMLTDYFSDSLRITSFWWALVASLIISFISSVVNSGSRAVTR